MSVKIITLDGREYSTSQWNYLMERRISPRKRRMVVTKSKVDTTELKKLQQALGIMLIDASQRAGYKMPDAIKITLEKRRPASSGHAAWLVKIKRHRTVKRRSYWPDPSADDFKYHLPARCANLILEIRRKYPRMSEISDKDRTYVTESSDVNEESVAWAEEVSKSVGVAVTKDQMYTLVETETRVIGAMVLPPGEDDPERNEQAMRKIFRLKADGKTSLSNRLFGRIIKKDYHKKHGDIKIVEI